MQEDPAASKTKRPVCPTCSKPAGAALTKFGIRHSCCGLWSWDSKPLVSAATHAARKAAHVAFDKLWQRHGLSRGAAYAALATEMKLAPADCHIALMTKEQCERVIELSATMHPPKKPAPKRANFIGLNPW